MIVFDANILIYAYDSGSSRHTKARAWVEETFSVLAPGEQHWPLLRQMVIEGQASGALVSDAQIAALTIEYGGVLYTADRDFARFPGLRWKNPLE